MKQIELPFPELFAIAVTRAALGAGLALLLGNQLPEGQRRRLGTVLTIVGILSTIPLAYDVLCSGRQGL